MMSSVPDTGESGYLLFPCFSDSPQPRFTDRRGKQWRVDPVLKEAAQDAIDSSIVFHSFGLAEAAQTPIPHPLSHIAGATGGTYYPVNDASELGCQLLASLLP